LKYKLIKNFLFSNLGGFQCTSQIIQTPARVRRQMTFFLNFYPPAFVRRGSKFCFVVVVVVLGTLLRILHYCPISPCFQHIAPWPMACIHALPSSIARQPCPAALPGSLARQPCPAALPGSLAWQPFPAALIAWQTCRNKSSLITFCCVA
jgi:hypothetical protein